MCAEGTAAGLPIFSGYTSILYSKRETEGFCRLDSSDIQGCVSSKLGVLEIIWCAKVSKGLYLWQGFTHNPLVHNCEPVDNVVRPRPLLSPCHNLELPILERAYVELQCLSFAVLRTVSSRFPLE